MIDLRLMKFALCSVFLGAASPAVAQSQSAAGDAGSATPSSSRAALDQAAATAEADWISCLQDQALRQTLRAVDAGAAPSTSPSVFAACAEKEEAVAASAIGASADVDSPEARSARRARHAASLDQLIGEIYAGYNHR